MKGSEHERTVVLVVDDDIESIRMINDVLEDAGMTALVALEGRQALAITRNITPDVVLMDAIMPNMDGFETCRQLKENPELSHVPVIFMTGLSDTEHVVMGLTSGGVDYVTKPISAPELIARMKVHLANARVARSARAALDSAGQFLLACNLEGERLWATPQAQQRLHDGGADRAEAAASIKARLNEWLSRQPEKGHTLKLDMLSDALSVEFLAQVDENEYLLRLSQASRAGVSAEMLRERFNLTAREGEVLLWIGNGKTNREIGQILDMSPRTVNKHLEQIFRKLNVENRTSAAAMAIRCLGDL